MFTYLLSRAADTRIHSHTRGKEERRGPAAQVATGQVRHAGLRAAAPRPRGHRAGLQRACVLPHELSEGPVRARPGWAALPPA